MEDASLPRMSIKEAIKIKISSHNALETSHANKLQKIISAYFSPLLVYIPHKNAVSK